MSDLVDIQIAESIEDSLERAQQSVIDNRLLDDVDVDVLLANEYSMSQPCFVCPADVVDNPLGWFDESAAEQLPDSDVYVLEWNGQHPHIYAPMVQPLTVVDFFEQYRQSRMDEVVQDAVERCRQVMIETMSRAFLYPSMPWVSARIENPRYDPSQDRTFIIGVDPASPEPDRTEVLTIAGREFVCRQDDSVEPGVVFAVAHHPAWCTPSRHTIHGGSGGHIYVDGSERIAAFMEQRRFDGCAGRAEILPPCSAKDPASTLDTVVADE